MRQNLICTVGVSLLYPNLSSLPKKAEDYQSWLNKQPKEDQCYFTTELVGRLTDVYQNNDLHEIAKILIRFPSNLRICGAEINSVDLLLESKKIPEKCNLYLFYSDTPDGRKVKDILEIYFNIQGFSVQKSVEIENLNDENPKLFRTKGLRNLAKQVCRILFEQGTDYSAINATGGYKAQIAIAVLIGQSLGVPVYYKHERFNEIISFPPMPISLDFDLWLKTSGWLINLDKCKNLIYRDQLEEDYNEQVETLIDYVDLGDGKIGIELSATGQIFLETFKNKFSSEKDQILPPNTITQSKPELTAHGWGNAREPILRYLNKITNDFPYVSQCRTHYWNPDLSSPNLFRLKGSEIEGVLSNGTWTVKFYVDTSSTTEGQKLACIADLNHQLIDN